MSRAKKLADRIRAEIPIVEVLAEYGYAVNPGGGDREQQFSCDLHGSGRDAKPSARVYPDSNSWYCFGCGRARDAIQTVREKEGVEFWAAIKSLEKRYRLPELPWDDEDTAVEVTISDKVREILQAGQTRDDVQKRIQRQLEILTTEREIPMETVTRLWEVFDRVVHGIDNEEWPESVGVSRLLDIRTLIDEAVQKAAR